MVVTSRFSAKALHDFLASHSALLAIAIFFIVGVAVFDDYGIFADDPTQRNLAIMTVDYMLGNDEELLTHKDKIYGVAFELPLLFVERALGLTDTRDIYLSRHILTHCFFLMGGFFCALLVYRMYASRWLALCALLLFLLHPRIYAHSFFNPKDIPFLSMFTIALFLIHRAFEKGTLSGFLLCGIGVALLTNIRILGVMLFCAVLVMCALDLWRAADGSARVRILRNGVAFAFVGMVALYATWPYLWRDPIGNMIVAFTEMADFPHAILPQRFRGEEFMSDALPPDYLPHWIGITTPPVALLLILIGIIFVLYRGIAHPGDILRNTPLRFGFLVLGCFALPMLAAILLGSNLYDGWRHFFFAQASFSVLATCGLHGIASAVERKSLRVGGYALVVIGFAVTLVEMVHIHPHQQAYFNALVDRNKPGYLQQQYISVNMGPSRSEPLKYVLEQYPDSTLYVSNWRWHSARRLNRIIGMLSEADRRRVFFGRGLNGINVHIHPKERTLEKANAQRRGNRKFFTASIIAKREVFGMTLWQMEKLDIRPGTNPLAFYRDVYRSAVAGEALAKSVFDIYLDEGHLIYIKTPCGQPGGDTRFFLRVHPSPTAYEKSNWKPGLDTSFFLHVFPKDKADLPAKRKPFNFDNLDFRFTGPYGMRFDDKCLMRIPLPDYAIDHIRTGEYRLENYDYVPIWQATFRIPDARLED